MACGGPSQDHAYERADAAWAEIMHLLHEKYQVHRPHILKGTMMGKEVEIGFGRKWQKEFDEQAEQIRLLLREMAWNSDCADW